MTLYAFALFLHIVGALGIFAALGLEWASLWHLRRAGTAEQAREWLGLFSWLRRIGPVSLAALLLAGIYMTVVTWRGTPWIGVSLAAMLAFPALGAISGRRVAAIEHAAAAESGPLPEAIRQQLRDPFLWISIQTRLGVAIGIVFLMTIKPGLSGALLVMAAAIVLGLASSLPALNREQTNAPIAKSDRPL